MTPVEAYKIKVSFVADAESIKKPLVGVTRSLSVIEKRQKTIDTAFKTIASSIQATLIPAQKLADIMSVIATSSLHMASGAKTLKRITMDVAPPAQAAYASSLRGGSRGSTPNSLRPTQAMPLPPFVAAPEYSRPSSGRGPAVQSTMSLFGAKAGPSAYGVAGGDYSRVSSTTMRNSGVEAEAGVFSSGIWGSAPKRQVTPLSEAPRASFGRRAGYAYRQVASHPVSRAAGAAWGARPALSSALSLRHIVEGYLAFEFLRSSFNTEGDFQSNIVRATASDPQDRSSISRMAIALSKSNPYVSRLEASGLISEAYAAGGYNLKETAALTPSLARAYTALTLTGSSHEQAFNQSRKLINGLDILGAVYGRNGEVDPKKLSGFTDATLKGVLVDKYNLTPDKIFTFANSSGSAGKRLDVTGYTELLRMISLQPARVGTALKSLENLLAGPGSPLYKKNRLGLERLGILDKSGRLPDEYLLHSRPQEWLAKHYWNVSDAQRKQLYPFLQRANIQDIVVESQSLSGNTKKNIAAINRVDLDYTLDGLSKLPRGAEARLGVAWSNFQQAVGSFEAGPGIRVLDKLTSVLNRMTNYIDKNPDKFDKLADNIGKLVTFSIDAASALGSIVGRLPVDKLIKLASALGLGLTGARFGGTVGAIFGPEGAAIGAGIGGGIGLATGYVGASYALGDYSPKPYNMNDPAHDYFPHDGLRAQRMAYASGSGNAAPSGDLHVHVNVDGREVARHVESLQNRNLWFGANTDTSWYDSAQGRRPPAAGAFP